MADPVANLLEGVFAPRVETDKLIGASGLAERVVNLQATPEDSLRTISGPAMMISEADIEIHGIAHAIFGTKEVLIRQTTDRLQVFEGWKPSGQWRDLTLPSPTPGQVGVDIITGDTPLYPMMVITTPIGIIIFPKGDTIRPLFYDGEVVANLGYQQTPGAPTLTLTQELTVTNMKNSVNTDIGNRIGVVESIQGSTINNGRRKRSEYYGAVQWINKWNDLSPQSPHSNTIIIPDGVIKQGSDLEAGLARARWDDVESGPPHTKGRICLRTRSLTTSGSTQLWELPQHEQPSSRLLSTIPDNIGNIYMDNVSEGRLALPGREIAPVPQARVGTLAMGRVWLDSPDGGVWWSLPGRWGTFGKFNVLYPDNSGDSITGMHPVEGGLLVFTLTSTYFVSPNDTGEGFRSVSLSSRLGCIAPATIRTLPGGDSIWMGRGGFNAFSGGTVSAIRDNRQRLMRQLNKGRLLQCVAEVIDGIYHCWVPHGADKVPSLCLTHNGLGWDRRDDVAARGVAVSRDYRGYAFIAGIDNNTGRKGVLLLDRENNVLGSQNHTAVLETTWMLATGVDEKSIRRIILWARETGLTNITVEIMEDWREKVTETITIALHDVSDAPGTWDTEVLGLDPATGETAIWNRRRPYYGVVDLDLPSIEAIKLRFTATADIDFIGFILQTGAGVRGGSWGD